MINCVSCIFGWGSNITECVHLFGFFGGGANNVLDK